MRFFVQVLCGGDYLGVFIFIYNLYRHSDDTHEFYLPVHTEVPILTTCTSFTFPFKHDKSCSHTNDMCKFDLPFSIKLPY